MHVVKNESIVDDFESEVTRLVGFLGAEWDSVVLDYAEHARRRERIITPSYSQVTEPLYSRAKFRWRKYREPLAPVMPKLEEYAHQFGYQFE